MRELCHPGEISAELRAELEHTEPVTTMLFIKEIRESPDRAAQSAK